ncbi:XRE family transcriptional regulator [Clostridium tertium]|uniref:XRE family transcriptional regulator n=1 Tax=Clostridium tertium TaxID=1559 RepID=UPI001C1E6909|nr:XRE family transcriptional regulator [Clostridium tertium]MBU6134018.1 XRE family transcriptional regulator [Clostridium tertium]
MSERNIIGENIRYFRKKQNLIQEGLTAKLQTLGLEIYSSMLTKIELKKRESYYFEIDIISKVLNLKIDDLFQK